MSWVAEAKQLAKEAAYTRFYEDEYGRVTASPPGGFVTRRRDDELLLPL